MILENIMIDTSNMIEITNLKSSNIEDCEEVISLSQEAKRFLESQSWCKSVVKGMFDRGWNYIVGVFLFFIEPAHEGIPDCIWVIVGDLPPAYIDANDNPNGACAIDAYVLEMEKWVEGVMRGHSVEDLIPVNVQPRIENAEMLRQRLDIIKSTILVHLNDEIQAGLAKIQ
jgi:hypothetical protein